MNIKKIFIVVGVLLALVAIGFAGLVAFEAYETRDLSESFTYDTIKMSHPADWEPLGEHTEDGMEMFIFRIEESTKEKRETVMFVNKYIDETFQNKEQLYSTSKTVRAYQNGYNSLSVQEGTIGSENAVLEIYETANADPPYMNAVLDIYDEDSNKGYFILALGPKDSWSEHGPVIKRVLERVEVQ